MSNKRNTMSKGPKKVEGAQTRSLADEPRNPAPAEWIGLMFSPGAPQRPMHADDEQPRVFDYAPNINLYITPRTGYGLLPFRTLRAFADTFQYARIVIEAFKREIRALEWNIVPINEEDTEDYSDEIKRLRKFWRKPDGVLEFDSWMNSVLSDMLEIDAVSLFLRPGPGNTVAAVQQIDGSMIRPLLNQFGAQPLPPDPAFMQVTKGLDWMWLTSERLLYRPFNTGIGSPYGKSPVEFILAEINTALQRQASALQYWNQTNTPEALVGLPNSWTLDQIKAYQEYFDLLMSGQPDKLRRIKFFPTDGVNIPVHEFRRPETGAGATTLDEWSLKVCCWAFGFLPSEFGLIDGKGLGGSGFLAGQENTMYRFGVGPVIQFIQNLITGIIERQTKAPLCFKFTRVGPSEDKQADQNLNDSKLRSGIIDINVLRVAEGQKPIPNAQPFIVVGSTIMLLEDVFNPKPPPPQLVAFTGQGNDAAAGDDPAQDDAREPPAKAEPTGEQVDKALNLWREKVRRKVAEGKSALCEPPDLAKAYLSADMCVDVREQLRAGDVDGAFSVAGKKKFSRPISHALIY